MELQSICLSFSSYRHSPWPLLRILSINRPKCRPQCCTLSGLTRTNSVSMTGSNSIVHMSNLRVGADVCTSPQVEFLLASLARLASQLVSLSFVCAKSKKYLGYLCSYIFRNPSSDCLASVRIAHTRRGMNVICLV